MGHNHKTTRGQDKRLGEVITQINFYLEGLSKTVSIKPQGNNGGKRKQVQFENVISFYRVYEMFMKDCFHFNGIFIRDFKG